VRVGEGREHHRGQLQPGEPAIRPVQHVDPDLLLDHVDLVEEVLLGQPRAAHPVGLEKERPFQGARRQDLEIVGVVEVGGAVEGATRPLHVPEVSELLQVFRALEHQMFEEMGETRPAFRFGTDAHVIDHGDPDHGCAAIGRENHPQAVLQGESLDRILRCGDLSSARHGLTLARSVFRVATAGHQLAVRQF
jgi:hypothetical protein